jgi:hypothetical protein
LIKMIRLVIIGYHHLNKLTSKAEVQQTN